jgi:hypothetical protein
MGWRFVRGQRIEILCSLLQTPTRGPDGCLGLRAVAGRLCSRRTVGGTERARVVSHGYRLEMGWKF